MIEDQTDTRAEGTNEAVIKLLVYLRGKKGVEKEEDGEIRENGMDDRLHKQTGLGELVFTGVPT